MQSLTLLSYSLALCLKKKTYISFYVSVLTPAPPDFLLVGKEVWTQMIFINLVLYIYVGTR